MGEIGRKSLSIFPAQLLLEAQDRAPNQVFGRYVLRSRNHLATYSHVGRKSAKFFQASSCDSMTTRDSTTGKDLTTIMQPRTEKAGASLRIRNFVIL